MEHSRGCCNISMEQIDHKETAVLVKICDLINLGYRYTRKYSIEKQCWKEGTEARSPMEEIHWIQSVQWRNIQGKENNLGGLPNPKNLYYKECGRVEIAVDKSAGLDTTQYDLIIGTDILTELTMDLQFSKYTIQWDDLTIPIRGDGSKGFDIVLQQEQGNTTFIFLWGRLLFIYNLHVKNCEGKTYFCSIIANSMIRYCLCSFISQCRI